MGMGMFTPRMRSGLQVTLAATALSLGIGLGGAAAVTLSLWFVVGAAGAALVAVAAWFWPNRGEADEQGMPSAMPTPRATPGFSNEAYGFTEWQADAPTADPVSAAYPRNVARDMLEAPRVYAEEAAEAPPPRPARRTTGPPSTKPVRHWQPGAPPAPAAFRDRSTGEELVEFQVVNAPTTAPTIVSHGARPAPATEPMREIPVERPASEFVPDLGSSRFADFYEPKKPRYEKSGLSDELKRRRERMARELPLVGGMLSDEPRRDEPADSHPGKTRGKCGKCSTYLWAPAKRPLRVRCPKCGHEARLT